MNTRKVDREFMCEEPEEVKKFFTDCVFWVEQKTQRQTEVETKLQRNTDLLYYSFNNDIRYCLRR